MTQKEMFSEVLYKALGDGVAKLIKNGLAFTVMTGVIIGLVWTVFYLHGLHSTEVKELRAEMLQLRREHSEQLDTMRREVAEAQCMLIECNMARDQDAARIARLEGLIQSRNR